MEKASSFLNTLIINVIFFCLGGAIGAVIGILVVYVGTWSVMVLGGIVALGLHLEDK